MKNTEKIKDYIKKLDSSNSEEQEIAALEIGKILKANQKAIDAHILIKLINKYDDYHIKGMLIYSLGQTRSQTAIETLINLLENTNYKIRWVAVEALGNIRNLSEEYINLIINFLGKEEEFDVKIAAIKTLGKFKTKKSISILYKYSKKNEEDSWIREQAQDSLEKLLLSFPIPTPPIIPILPLLKGEVEKVVKLISDLGWRRVEFGDFAYGHRAVRSDITKNTIDQSSIQQAISTLQRKGMKMPALQELIDSSLCTDINIDNIFLEISISPWFFPLTDLDDSEIKVDTQEDKQEFSLLVIVRRKDSLYLPEKMTLQVKKDTGDILSQKTVQTSHQRYLNSCIRGNQSDRFEITIIFNEIKYKVANSVFDTNFNNS